MFQNIVGTMRTVKMAMSVTIYLQLLGMVCVLKINKVMLNPMKLIIFTNLRLGEHAMIEVFDIVGFFILTVGLAMTIKQVGPRMIMRVDVLSQLIINRRKLSRGYFKRDSLLPYNFLITVINHQNV
jgi:hypothetical protein